MKGKMLKYKLDDITCTLLDSCYICLSVLAKDYIFFSVPLDMDHN